MVCLMMFSRGMHINNKTKCSKALSLVVRIVLAIFLYRLNHQNYITGSDEFS